LELCCVAEPATSPFTEPDGLSAGPDVTGVEVEVEVEVEVAAAWVFGASAGSAPADICSPSPAAIAIARAADSETKRIVRARVEGRLGLRMPKSSRPRLKRQLSDHKNQLRGNFARP
jgi:hypothetical protein